MIDYYDIVIYWSEADRAYIAEMPELPGCAADGSTPQEALENLRQIALEWVETAQSLGRPVPEPKRRKVSA